MSNTAFDDLVDRGVVAHEQKRFDEALESYQQALELNPWDAEATSLRGLALTHLGRIEEARPALEKAIEQEPDQPSFRLNLVECLECSNEIVRAAKEVDVVLGMNARLPRAWEKKGDLASRIRAFDLAAQAYATASGLNRDSPMLAIKLARAHAAQKDFADAHKALDRAVALAPNSSAVLELRAAILTVQMDWAGLEAVSRLWINATPENSAAWHRFAHATFERGLYRQSIAAYDKVLELTERSATNLTAFARICLHALEHDKASSALDEAESRNPNHVEMLAAKSLLLTYRGDFDEALRYCRRCLKLDPHYAPAYTQLTQLTRGQLSGSEKQALEKLASDESEPAENRILAQFARADGYDADGDIDAAFAAYATANAMQVAQNRAENLVYRREATEARTKKLIALFNDPPEAGDLPEGPRPLFIVGMPRSGTTLVESVLAAHSMVTPGGERPLMMQILDGYMHLNANRTVTHEQLQKLARIYLDEGPARDGVITDKNPLNFEAVGLIMRLFPNAVVIHMRRDPLETGLSIFRHEFAKFWRFAHRLEDIGHFYAHYNMLVEHWQRVYPERFITVQYEDFASNFASGVKQVVAGCGLEWEDACEHYQDSAPVIATLSAVQAREPVSVRRGKADLYAGHLGPLREALEAFGQ